MNISLFFDPVSEELINLNSDFGSFENAFYINTQGTIEWRNYHIALIGLNEYRSNSIHTENQLHAADNIRKELYKLKKSQVTYNMCDLGNLRAGETTTDTQERLREVCSALLENNTIPIIIGGTHDMSVGQYHGYQHLQKLVTVLNIDSCIDLQTDHTSENNGNFLNKILLHEPNYLMNFIQLGYQSYLNDHNLLNVFEKLNFEHYRLGSLRDQFEEIEPTIRQANMISIDLNAVKIQDAPAQYHNRPFGFTGEELCRIAWYAGLGEKSNSFGIYEYYPELDKNCQTANLIATVIWYFVEGYYHRIPLENFGTDAFINYKVSVSEYEILEFFKHKYTEKWWLKVPKLNSPNPDVDYITVPCSYKDYLSANQGDLPNRWIQSQARML